MNKEERKQFEKEVTQAAELNAKKWTGEDVKAEMIKGQIFYYGSELATLKLFRKFAKYAECDQGYSQNLETYYFTRR